MSTEELSLGKFFLSKMSSFFIYARKRKEQEPYPRIRVLITLLSSSKLFRLDLAELDSLLSTAKRHSSLLVLRQARLSTEAKLAAIIKSKQENTTTSPPVLATSKPQEPLSWTPITRYGFEQDDNFVTVLAFELPGVGAAKDRAKCDFTKDSFDLTITDVDNGSRIVSYRLRVINLEKDIVPAESRFKVKKSSIEIKLRKTGKFDHWMELVSKKSKEAKAKSDADPAASINDMMRQMYEDGDEATRKIIGEAMLKSREEQMKNGGKNTGGGSGRGGMGMSNEGIGGYDLGGNDDL
jgi:calcyclin binding protein